MPPAHKINRRVLREMYLGGVPSGAIARYLKCSLSALNKALASLNLPRRGRGWRPADWRERRLDARAERLSLWLSGQTPPPPAPAPPRRLDYPKIARLRGEGKSLDRIAAELECSRGGVRYALSVLGLKRPRGWKPAGYSETIRAAIKRHYALCPRPRKPESMSRS